MACSVLWWTIAGMLCVEAPTVFGIGFGSLNNFDAVNDNGVQCYGFEIEIDGIFAREITYTYDWNHYGVPTIREDTHDPLHPKVWVRYQSTKGSDGKWVAFTAVPSGPIAPTDGHQFTNPAINFGGEHFGVGFSGTPAAVLYHWLVDDGAGNLVYGTAVNISTPTFVYVAPQNNAPAQVQAVIVPPPPPALPALEFGEAIWVKETRTSSHNNRRVELRDLVSDDPNNPDDRNWKNGEPDEVEVEWQLLQVEFNAVAGGKNGELAGAPEELPGGDEVITRRYDFFKYIGPIDAETGEALAESVGADGVHGRGIKSIGGIETDLSTVVVVGGYIGAQMAGFDAAQKLGLIDHLQDGRIYEPYVERTLVVGGTAPIVTRLLGLLPVGMNFNEASGVLSGTPQISGSFSFSVESTDSQAIVVSHEYFLTILSAEQGPPAHVTISVLSLPQEGGTVTGGGEVSLGADARVDAVALPGFAFVSWTDGGTRVSVSPTFTFTAELNRKLTAVFLPTYRLSGSAFPLDAGTITGSGTYTSGESVTLVATANAGYVFLNWSDNGSIVRTSQSYTFLIDSDHSPIANFAPTYGIGASAVPASGGSVSGGGIFASGSQVTLVANANPGYTFLNWKEGDVVVSEVPTISFSAASSRSLQANFSLATYTVSAVVAPLSGGCISGGGLFTSGSQVTLVAQATPGFVFLNWTEGGAVVSVSPNLSIIASSDRLLSANFAPLGAIHGIRHLCVHSLVTGGRSAEVEIELCKHAPKGGAWIRLASSNSDVVRIPAKVFVPCGRKSVSVRAETSRVREILKVEITATLGASIKSGMIKVLPRRASAKKD